MSTIDEFIVFLRNLAEKWSNLYEEDRVFEADPSEGEPKYFLTAAYMYPNAPIHVGHGRTYLIADVLARFKRLLRYNVLFPMGFHYTGTPVLVRVEAILENKAKEIESMSRTFNIEVETLKKLRDPVSFARYFHELSKTVMKKYGLSIDWRREFTTVDPEYKSFIQWQFTKLLEKDLLIRGTYPVGWCPRHGMPVSMHDTEGDVEPEVGELTLIKFTDEYGVKYPVATLRPETVLGVTNIWVNPEARYCISRVNSEVWVTSCEATTKLKQQLKSVEILEEVGGGTLVDRELVNPVTGERVRVLPASFVNPKFATGLVMSVPAHAPYDYAALRDYVEKNLGGVWTRELMPKPLIQVSGYGEIPARNAVEQLGVRSQSDVELLEEATKRVYRDEFERGIFRPDAVAYVVSRDSRVLSYLEKHVAGKPVPEAREAVRALLEEIGVYDSMYEVMNAPVRCRCGSEVAVKVLENQWFINYGSTEWKNLTREALKDMRVVPEEARRGIEATIDWLRERACARTRGLGTELPWAPGWVVEALSDSTIYMAFYTVVHRIRKLGVKVEKLGEYFWDYVFLGLGDAREVAAKIGISVEDLESMRREFLFWYPLDSRHSGKDLIPNHLTFFVFNHIAIFPRELWPKQIVVNGWVLVEGAKMSKSKGNVKLLGNLMDTYSPDALRLGLAFGAEVDQDLDLNEETVLSAARQLMKIYNTIREILHRVSGDSERPQDIWLRKTLATHVVNYVEELENVRIRAAALRVYVKMLEDLETYLKWAREPGRAAVDYIATWVKLMSPYTPFIAEELWRTLGGRGYVAKSAIERELVVRDTLFEFEQKYVDLVIEDIKSVLDVVSGDTVAVYTSDRELSWIVERVAEDVARGIDLSETVRKLSRDLAKAGIRQPDRVVKSIREAVSYIGPEVVLKYLKTTGGIDEFEILSKLQGLVATRLGLKNFVVYRASDTSTPDLGGRKSRAFPLKPGIYVTQSTY
ncbi:MAG: leucine--tRNA ligase [Sulfolobales archaeon]|nr:leucine--tRNA ligase [Sulfolobales archaeon]MDW8083074.1 leucine--tRNA ligase [Sulfolobales archaeon]